MPRSYYNDNDPTVCQWARNLIAAGLVPEGDVDERSIAEVQPSDLKGYTQCHFFCGILGWPLALSIAGVPASEPLWTGSCPCQPFSVAGRGKAQEDTRHLWPAWFRLIRECRPERVFGEQVTGAIGWGWLDGVSTDLEAEGYAVGSAVLGAHSVGAPHRRQRVYWMADASGQRRDGEPVRLFGRGSRQEGTETLRGSGSGLAYPTEREAADQRGLHPEPRSGRVVGQADIEAVQSGDGPHDGVPWVAGSRDPWGDYGIVWCDERAFGHGFVPRRVESGTFPLAHGVSGRVVKLRAYGNAICPEAAAEFVRASYDVLAARR